MHPIERLRMVARASGEGPGAVAREAAAALAACADDPMALVTACRRLVDRQRAAGPLWWAASRILTAADPGAEAWRVAAELDADPSPAALAAALPDAAQVAVLGWPDQAVEALVRRGDITVAVVDVLGDGTALARALDHQGVEAVVVPESGLGAAVAAAGLLVLDAAALGDDGLLAVCGSRAAAAVAYTEGVPVWGVAGVGRALPGRLWRAAARTVLDDSEPWTSQWDFVPLGLVSAVVGPEGVEVTADALARAGECPEAPELLGPLGR